MILVISSLTKTMSNRMYPSLNPNTMSYQGAFRPQSGYLGESHYGAVARLTGSELNIVEGQPLDNSGEEQMPDPKYFGACEGCADSEIFERPNVYTRKKKSAPPLPNLEDAEEDEKTKRENEEDEKRDPFYYQKLLRGRKENEHHLDAARNAEEIDQISREEERGGTPPMPKKPSISEGDEFATPFSDSLFGGMLGGRKENELGNVDMEALGGGTPPTTTTTTTTASPTNNQ